MKKVTIIETDARAGRYWEKEEKEPEKTQDFVHMFNIYPDMKEQTVEGFGGAFTEAAAHCFYSLEEKAREIFLDGYFGPEGLGYNMGRVSINSCDFALGNYTYVEEGDTTLDSFTLAHDKKQIFPLIRLAMKRHSETGRGEEDMRLLASPWSPPAYMKTNGEMNHGGSLKKEYYPLWAAYYVKYLQEALAAGMPVRYLTVQNEPEAVQTWDSCIYSAQEEADFAGNYLLPALEQNGLSHIGLFMWDHNKESLYDRAKVYFQNETCRKKATGLAVHWYSGDHFEAIEAVKMQYPGKRVFFTEGCVEYACFADSDEVQKAEMYAHDMLGDLKAGVEAFLDWNLLLDEKGGPNHVGNFCAAPMLCDGKGGVEKQLSYYYIGHFSRYIRRGARRIQSSCYTNWLESVAFLNPDGTKVAVILNRGNQDRPVALSEAGVGISFLVKARSIVTLLVE